MVNIKDYIKIKEYDNFILFEQKKTGIKECFLKTDLFNRKNEKKNYQNKWERSEY